MANTTTAATPGQFQPVRIIYKEMLDGDRKKVQAKSNKAKSGGGARDFRFNHEAFGPVFAKMFPLRKRETRKRNGKKGKLELYVGRLCGPLDSERSDDVPVVDIFYEPPTTARGAEGRIATVHKYAPFRQYPWGVTERVFLLLVEDESNRVWAFYATESSLTTDPEWDPAVARPILECLAQKRGRQAVRGWIDLTIPEHYCHGTKRPRRSR